MRSRKRSKQVGINIQIFIYIYMKQTNNNTKYISDKTPISDCTKNVISVDVYFTTQGQVHSARKMHSPIQHSISQFNNCLVIMQIFIGCKVYN